MALVCALLLLLEDALSVVVVGAVDVVAVACVDGAPCKGLLQALGLLFPRVLLLLLMLELVLAWPLFGACVGVVEDDECCFILAVAVEVPIDEAVVVADATVVPVAALLFLRKQELGNTRALNRNEKKLHSAH